VDATKITRSGRKQRMFARELAIFAVPMMT